MKKNIRNIIRFIARIIFNILNTNRFSRELIEVFLSESWLTNVAADANGNYFQFVAPNNLNFFRAETFATKEPETLDWIDSLEKNSVLWDIGANVGLYSCYAAKTRGCDVYAFEPSVFNLELLARNIFINALTSKVTIIPLALSDKKSVSQLNMTSTEWGGALSTFGKNYGHDGLELNKVFSFRTFGISIDEVVADLKIPSPDYIKMDVDGIEQLILSGGKKVLKKVKSISIEINEDFLEQKHNAEKILKASGLKLLHKKHSDLFDEGEFKNTYNQVWVR